jgi:hypothetical protein
MLTTCDGTPIPAGLESWAGRLRDDLSEEADRWEDHVPQRSTDWTSFNRFLKGVFDTLPESRYHGGAGREADDVLRHLLRTLPMRQRLAIEHEYQLWSCAENEKAPEAVLAYALDLSIAALRVELHKARQTLMHYREPFLVQLAFAELRQAEPG